MRRAAHASRIDGTYHDAAQSVCFVMHEKRFMYKNENRKISRVTSAQVARDRKPSLYPCVRERRRGESRGIYRSHRVHTREIGESRRRIRTPAASRRVHRSIGTVVSGKLEPSALAYEDTVCAREYVYRSFDPTDARVYDVRLYLWYTE